MCRNAIVGFVVGSFVLSSAPALAGPTEEAAEAYAQGRTLLAKADFAGASEAFGRAARTDAENGEYRRQYSMVRQVMRLRVEIEKEEDSARWWGMARSLRAYYHGHRIYSEALPLDREIHRRRATVESAVMLAEAQLGLGQHSEAAETLRGVDKGKATPRANVLLALALARGGRLEDAGAIAGKVAIKDDAGPRAFYELACLRALLGDTNGALAALTRSFELTPPTELETAKADAKACGDFSSLAGSPGLAKAMQAQSDVKASKRGKRTMHEEPKQSDGTGKDDEKAPED